MMARLMAWLGLDARNFNAGIDGAKRKTQSFEQSIKNVRRSIYLAFAIQAIRQFTNAAKELRDYQERTGVVLVSDDQLRNLDEASAKMEKLGMTIKTKLVQALSAALGGWEDLWAGIGAFFGGARGEDIGKTIDEAKAEKLREQTEGRIKKLGEELRRFEEQDVEYPAAKPATQLGVATNQIDRLTGLMAEQGYLSEKDWAELEKWSKREIEIRKTIATELQKAEINAAKEEVAARKSEMQGLAAWIKDEESAILRVQGVRGDEYSKIGGQIGGGARVIRANQDQLTQLRALHATAQRQLAAAEAQLDALTGG